jgi:hypothetical protein
MTALALTVRETERELDSDPVDTETATPNGHPSSNEMMNTFNKRGRMTLALYHCRIA